MTKTLSTERKSGWLWLPLILLLGGLAAIVISDPLGDRSEDQIPEIPTTESTIEAPAEY